MSKIKSMNGKKIILSLLVVCFIVLGCITLTSCDLFDGFKNQNVYNETVNNYNITVTDEVMALRYAAAEVKESAVLIKATYTTSTASGSGTLITSDGYILTNAHVAFANSVTPRSIDVTVQDNKGKQTTYSAELVKRNGNYQLDMAIIKITNAGEKKFKPAGIAKSSTLQLGDTAFMYGNSASTGFTLMSAIIANPLSNEFASNSKYGIDKIVKINADVNHGNSGGGLFNLKGDLSGVVTYRKESTSSSPSTMIQGIGYALRTEELLPIIKAHYGDELYNKLKIETYDDVVTVESEKQ